MSNRAIREPANALAQRLARMEERLRAMSLRTWPGAVRTGAGSDIDLAADQAVEDSVLMTLQAVAGRWVVFGQAQFSITSPTTFFDFRLAAYVVDPETAEPADDIVAVIAPRRTQIVGSTGTSVVEMTVVGSFTSERNADVQLAAKNLGGDGFTVRSPHLLLMPV